jgi:4-amino-4-deoxy-L-arabinose transferase-like glycosyltransferase
MFHLHPTLLDFFLKRELVGRVQGHVDGRHGPIYYYLLISALAWLPWWPLTFWKCWKNRFTFKQKPWMSILGLEGILVILGVIVFSLISSKLPTYTVIIAPWAALWMARHLLPLPKKSLFITTGLAISLYLILASIAPHYETRLGRNSSLKQIVEELRHQGALNLVADAYWPSLEIYFGESVQYIGVPVPTEDPTDTQHTPEHFAYAQSLPHQFPSQTWFIHYTKLKQTPLQPWLNDSTMTTLKAGDFLIGRLKEKPSNHL